MIISGQPMNVPIIAASFQSPPPTSFPRAASTSVAAIRTPPPNRRPPVEQTTPIGRSVPAATSPRQSARYRDDQRDFLLPVVEQGDPDQNHREDAIDREMGRGTELAAQDGKQKG